MMTTDERERTQRMVRELLMVAAWSMGCWRCGQRCGSRRHDDAATVWREVSAGIELACDEHADPEFEWNEDWLGFRTSEIRSAKAFLRVGVLGASCNEAAE